MHSFFFVFVVAPEVLRGSHPNSRKTIVHVITVMVLHQRFAARVLLRRYESHQRATRRKELVDKWHRSSDSQNSIGTSRSGSQITIDTNSNETPVPSKEDTTNNVLPVAFDRSLSVNARVVESSEQRRLLYAVRQCGSWSDAVSLVASSAATPPSLKVLEALTETVLAHRADAILRDQGSDLQTALSDGGSERWDTTDEERSALVHYVMRQHWRNAQHNADLTFDSVNKVVVEGPDNSLVNRLEHSMRKHSLRPSLDMIGDLMSLDINWSVALSLLRLAREVAPAGVMPVPELYERCIQLAAGMGKTSFGSRNWTLALRLYQEALSTGYENSVALHSGAMDAVWRSCNRTWLRPGGTIQRHHADQAWRMALRILHTVDTDPLCTREAARGASRCQLQEATIRAFCHMSKWDAALATLSTMELAASDTTTALAVPTAPAIAECIAACSRSGSYTYARMLVKLFESYKYQWRTLPAECLRTLVSTLRGVTDRSLVSSIAGPLLAPRDLLCDRKVAVELLQVLREGRVDTRGESAWRVALRLILAYDANVWPSGIVERRQELTALFFAVRSIAATHNTIGQHVLERHVAAWLQRIFGRTSTEYEWWEYSVVHRTTASGMTWTDAMALYSTVVRHRRARFLPLPMRQFRAILVRLMWRHVAPPSSRDDSEEADAEVAAVGSGAGAQDAALVGAHTTICAIYASPDDCIPHHFLAALTLRRAAIADSESTAAALGREGLQHAGLAPVALIRPLTCVAKDAADALRIPLEHAESLLGEMHTSLRHTQCGLAAEDDKENMLCRALEQVVW